MEILGLLKGFDLQTWALIAVGVAIYFTNGDLTKLKPMLEKLLDGFKPKPAPALEDQVDKILEKLLERLDKRNEVK